LSKYQQQGTRSGLCDCLSAASAVDWGIQCSTQHKREREREREKESDDTTVAQWVVYVMIIDETKLYIKRSFFRKLIIIFSFIFNTY